MREKREPRELLGIITQVGDQGYGWIHGADGEDYFFHAKAVRGSGYEDREKIFEGGRVRFIATDSPKGPRALNVEGLAPEVEVDGNRAEPTVIEEDELG